MSSKERFLDYLLHVCSVHAKRVDYAEHVIHMNIPSDPNEEHDFEERVIRAILPFSSHSDQYQF
jgi:hypothetical protein